MPVPTITTDRREDILVYLQVLLGTVSVTQSTIKACYRDRDALKETDNLPAILLLDGKEVLVGQLAQQLSTHNFQQMPPAVFQLQPQIFVQLVPRYDDTNLTVDSASGPVSSPIGPELSAYRAAIIRLLVNDTNLYTMLGSNGQVRFLGSETDMQAGAPMVGQLRMDFQFNYVVDPNKL